MKHLALLAFALVVPRAAAADTLADEPDAPAPVIVREPTPGPLYYRLPDDSVQGVGRSGIGFALRDGHAALTLEALPGAWIAFGRGARMGVLVEGGYAYARFHDHLAVLGAGPAVRRIGGASFALVPHAVIGSIGGDLGYGLRTSALATFAFVGVEVAHQILVVGDRRITEVHLALAFPVGFGG